jgi:hypothetical protein
MTEQPYFVEPMAKGSWIRKVLLINAVSSGGTGLILLLFSGFVAEWTGLDYQSAIMGVGFYLLMVVALLIWTATRTVVSPLAVLILSIIDFLWVLKSIILLGMNGTITAIGIAAVILVALVVGVFAVFEAIYYQRHRI